MNIIVYNNEFSKSLFTASAALTKVVLGNRSKFNFTLADSMGWVGQSLKTAAKESSEIFLVPAGFVKFDKLMALKNYANNNNIGLVASAISMPTSFPQDYYSLPPGFIAYINLENYNSNLDFGPVCQFNNSIHMYHSVQDANGHIVVDEQFTVATDINFDYGWILIKTMLESGNKIAEYSANYDPAADVVAATDEFLNCCLTRNYNLELNISEESFEDICNAVNNIDLENVNVDFKPEPVATKYNQPGVAVENFYCRSTIGNLKLLTNYSINSDTRLIFYAAFAAEFDLIKLVLQQWDGVNENTLQITNDSAAELAQLRSRFNTAAEFDTFWSHCQTIYKEWYLTDGFKLVDDIESQCHTNSVVVIDNGFSSLSLSRIYNCRLYSTEIVYATPQNTYGVEKIGTEVYPAKRYAKFRLTFRNTQTGTFYPMLYTIQNFFTAQKWARCMHHDYMLEDNCIVEKNYMLQQWEYDLNNPNARSIPVLCREMNRYVKVINDYFDGSSQRRVPYQITQYFDPATLDQQILNEIHHHFELLIGQVWSVSEYFKLADAPTSFAIRQLNNLCHEMEFLRRPPLRENIGTQNRWSAGVYFPFIPTVRYKFVECDYDHFTQLLEYGDIILHYAQLGKTPMEAWSARDEEVFDDNITGLRYLSGEFDIIYKRDSSYGNAMSQIERSNAIAFPWIRERGQDPESKFTGIGFIPVAKLDRDRYPGMTSEAIQLELYKNDDIYSIELLDADGNVIQGKTLDYTWHDVLKYTDPTHPEFTNFIKWDSQ